MTANDDRVDITVKKELVDATLDPLGAICESFGAAEQHHSTVMEVYDMLDSALDHNPRCEDVVLSLTTNQLLLMRLHAKAAAAAFIAHANTVERGLKEEGLDPLSDPDFIHAAALVNIAVEAVDLFDDASNAAWLVDALDEALSNA